MPHSDSEVVGAWRLPEEVPQLQRAASAPAGSLPVLDLDAMTQEAVALYQAGDAQAALDLAVAFANDAEQFMGRTHPMHVNALATVAALAEQMGCRKEAEDLLEEAEALHEEHEMEQEYYELQEELEESSGSSDVDRPAKLASPAMSTHTGSRASVEDPPGHSGSEDEEAEAESIRRLTWEVKEFLKDGHPELAAQLLAEAEAEMVGGEKDPDKAPMKGLTRAALHTLWAAVLEEVGEKDKAAALYDEALLCLKEEAALISSESEEDEAPAAPPELPRPPLPPLPRPGAARGRSPSSDEEEPNKGQPPLGSDEASASPPPKEQRDLRPTTPGATKAEAMPAPTPTPVLQQAPGEIPPVKAIAFPPKPATKTAVASALPPVAPRQVATPPSKPPAKTAPAADVSDKVSKASSTVEGIVQKALEEPTASSPQGPDLEPRQPSASSSRTVTPKATAKRRPPPLAPKASTKSAPTAVRVGGGFKVLSPSPPKAPTPPKAGKRPKAKARSKAASATPATEDATVVEQDGPVELPAESPMLDPPPPPQEEELSPEQLKQRALRVMVTADHFLGLSRFERAADLLEDQLEKISDESCPLCNTDLHVELLSKYGGILWWDGDAEGAIDAYTAADEILAERMQAEKDLQLMRRRAQIWGQMAQVFRNRGRLGAAERRLAAATATLELMLSMPECRSSAGSSDKPSFAASVQDLLRDMRAALGQVCVQKKDYDRAQELYLLAFSPEPRSSPPDPSP